MFQNSLEWDSITQQFVPMGGGIKENVASIVVDFAGMINSDNKKN